MLGGKTSKQARKLLNVMRSLKMDIVDIGNLGEGPNYTLEVYRSILHRPCMCNKHIERKYNSM